MTTFLLLLALTASVAVLVKIVALVIDHDGYGRPDPDHPAPRSHRPDVFDPRSPTRLA